MVRHLGRNVRITHRDPERRLVETVGLLRRVDRDNVQIRMGTDLNLGDVNVWIAMNAIASLHDYDSE
jgi:hypothetical protein